MPDPSTPTSPSTIRTRLGLATVHTGGLGQVLTEMTDAEVVTAHTLGPDVLGPEVAAAVQAEAVARTVTGPGRPAWLENLTDGGIAGVLGHPDEYPGVSDLTRAVLAAESERRAGLLETFALPIDADGKTSLPNPGEHGMGSLDRIDEVLRAKVPGDQVPDGVGARVVAPLPVEGARMAVPEPASANPYAWLEARAAQVAAELTDEMHAAGTLPAGMRIAAPTYEAHPEPAELGAAVDQLDEYVANQRAASERLRAGVALTYRDGVEGGTVGNPSPMWAEQFDAVATRTAAADPGLSTMVTGHRPPWAFPPEPVDVGALRQRASIAVADLAPERLTAGLARYYEMTGGKPPSLNEQANAQALVAQVIAYADAAELTTRAVVREPGDRPALDMITDDYPDDRTPEAKRLSVATNAAGWVLYAHDGRPRFTLHDVPAIDLDGNECDIARRVAARVVDHIDTYDAEVYLPEAADQPEPGDVDRPFDTAEQALEYLTDRGPERGAVLLYVSGVPMIFTAVQTGPDEYMWVDGAPPEADTRRADTIDTPAGPLMVETTEREPVDLTARQRSLRAVVDARPLYELPATALVRVRSRAGDLADIDPGVIYREWEQYHTAAIARREAEPAPPLFDLVDDSWPLASAITWLGLAPTITPSLDGMPESVDRQTAAFVRALTSVLEGDGEEAPQAVADAIAAFATSLRRVLAEVDPADLVKAAVWPTLDEARPDWTTMPELGWQGPWPDVDRACAYLNRTYAPGDQVGATVSIILEDGTEVEVVATTAGWDRLEHEVTAEQVAEWADREGNEV